MAGTSVTLTVDDAQVKAALARLTQALGDLAPALRDVGESLLRATDQRYRAERGPDGTPWPQLSDITLLRRLLERSTYSKARDERTTVARTGTLSARKTATGGRRLTAKGQKILAAAKILRDSGALQDTIRYQLTADGHGVAVGTNRVYGAMQQFGGTRAQWPHLWGDIPPRPFLGVSEADRAEIIAIFERHLAP